MATKDKSAQADKRPAEDAKGFVTITNGDVTAKVLPESFKVWEARGWTEAKDDVSVADADPFSDNPDSTENPEG